MQEVGHFIFVIQLKVKVAEITQTRATPFSHGIPKDFWWEWFKVRHPALSVRVAQGLDLARANGLTVEHCKSFYDNLNKLKCAKFNIVNQRTHYTLLSVISLLMMEL